MVLTLVSGLLVGGCSIKGLAVRQLGKALSEGTGGGAFASDEDIEFTGQAVPFSLKLIESLLLEQPDNPDLLLAAASGFTQYAYLWVDQRADYLEAENFEKAQSERQRARAFYLRAFAYAMRALDQARPGFTRTFEQDPQAAVQLLKKADVPVTYWTAASLGAAISLSKTDPAMLARQPQIEALLDRASALDPDWRDGTLHELHIGYEPVRPGAGEEGPKRARQHFHRVLELQGERASPLVSFAESVSVQEQNRAEFESLLRRALAVDPNARPELRLATVAAQQRARWLLGRIDELFLE